MDNYMNVDEELNRLAAGIAFVKMVDAFYHTWIGKLIGENRLDKLCGKVLMSMGIKFK